MYFLTIYYTLINKNKTKNKQAATRSLPCHSLVLHIQQGEVKSDMSSSVRVVQSLAGVRAPRLRTQILDHQRGRVGRHLDVAQSAGLGLHHGSLAVVVGQRHVVFSPSFGETPDEYVGLGWAAGQTDRASCCRANVGVNVFHLLGVVYLQTCNTRRLDWVTVVLYAPAGKQSLLLVVLRRRKTDRRIEDLTLCREWTVSACEDEWHA